MPKKARILLVGGGSGGHIIPNLAVASTLKQKSPDLELLYVASRNGLDAQLLKESGLKQKFIFSGKLRRYFSWQNFVDPFFLLVGFWQSVWILLRFRPQVVFSKGGYVSLPVVMAAFLLGRKVVLHESDSRMGLANRISARFATKVCVAFPALVKSQKFVLTGNPVRTSLQEGKAEAGYQLTGFSKNKPVLLVYGGSQGARQINELLQRDLARFAQHFQIVHITGGGQESARSDLHVQSPLDKDYVSFAYVKEELAALYAITDLVIGRAGANSIFELAFLQKPNILIPLANADQQNNAHYFQHSGASVVWHSGEDLFDLTWNLWHNEAQKKKMRQALKKLSRPHAAEEIADLILSL